MVDEMILGGAIEGVTVENNDIAGADIGELGQATETFIDNRTQYQQGHNECVVTSVRGCVADNTNIDFTLQDLDNMRKMLPDYGWNVNIGMYLDKGGALVVDYVRSTYNRPLTQNRYQTYENNNLKNMMSKGWSCQVGLRVNSQFYKDVMDNAQINYSVPTTGTGHSVRTIKRNPTNNNYLIDNNVDRLGNKNVIEITPEIFDKWIANKVFFNNFYIYHIPSNMITDSIPHYQGKTPAEKEKVKAWEDLVNSGKIIPRLKDYTEDGGWNCICVEVTLYKHGLIGAKNAQ